MTKLQVNTENRTLWGPIEGIKAAQPDNRIKGTLSAVENCGKKPSTVEKFGKALRIASEKMIKAFIRRFSNNSGNTKTTESNSVSTKAESLEKNIHIASTKPTNSVEEKSTFSNGTQTSPQAIRAEEETKPLSPKVLKEQAQPVEEQHPTQQAATPANSLTIREKTEIARREFFGTLASKPRTISTSAQETVMPVLKPRKRFTAVQKTVERQTQISKKQGITEQKNIPTVSGKNIFSNMMLPKNELGVSKEIPNYLPITRNILPSISQAEIVRLPEEGNKTTAPRAYIYSPFCSRDMIAQAMTINVPRVLQGKTPHPILFDGKKEDMINILNAFKNEETTKTRLSKGKSAYSKFRQDLNREKIDSLNQSNPKEIKCIGEYLSLEQMTFVLRSQANTSALEKIYVLGHGSPGIRSLSDSSGSCKDKHRKNTPIIANELKEIIKSAKNLIRIHLPSCHSADTEKPLRLKKKH